MLVNVYNNFNITLVKNRLEKTKETLYFTFLETTQTLNETKHITNYVKTSNKPIKS